MGASARALADKWNASFPIFKEFQDRYWKKHPFLFHDPPTARDGDVIAVCGGGSGEVARESNLPMFIQQVLPNTLRALNTDAALLCWQFTQPLASSQVPYRKPDA